MIYLVDTNVFFEARDEYYSFEVAPGFWDWLERANELGKVYSNVSVYSEIVPGKKTEDGKPDDCARWAMKNRESFFLPLPENMTKRASRIADWAKRTYDDALAEEFAEAADQSLVMQGFLEDFVVVTHESRKRKRNKIKIPVACDAFGVECINTYELLLREKVKLGLKDYSKERPRQE